MEGNKMTSERKPPRKRKLLEEKVLEKARKFVKLSDTGNPDDSTPEITADSTITMDLTPKVKLRKPRKGKNKDKALESSDKSKSEINNSADEQSGKKNKRNKKKNRRNKKKQMPQQLPKPGSVEKRAREAAEFLQTWHANRSEWKFEKLKQTWLLKHALNSDKIDDDHFEILLQYAVSIKGRGRLDFLHQMEEVVQKHDDKFAGEEDDGKVPTEGEALIYERARQLVQMLHEDDTD